MASSLATFTPTPKITVDASTPDGLTDRIVSVTVEESVDGLARAEIRLDNWGIVSNRPGYVYADRATIDFGKTIAVAAGPPDERATIFSGRVSAIEADYDAEVGPTVVILAEDALQDLRMTRRTRTL